MLKNKKSRHLHLFGQKAILKKTKLNEDNSNCIISDDDHLESVKIYLTYRRSLARRLLKRRQEKKSEQVNLFENLVAIRFLIQIFKRI
jgi:hypothetical protein